MMNIAPKKCKNNVGILSIHCKAFFTTLIMSPFSFLHVTVVNITIQRFLNENDVKRISRTKSQKGRI